MVKPKKVENSVVFEITLLLCLEKLELEMA